LPFVLPSGDTKLQNPPISGGEGGGGGVKWELCFKDRHMYLPGKARKAYAHYVGAPKHRPTLDIVAFIRLLFATCPSLNKNRVQWNRALMLVAVCSLRSHVVVKQHTYTAGGRQS